MGKLTLNVGCGGRTYQEFPPGHKCINFDERKAIRVDEVGDVRDLSRYPDEHFDYILASDIMEHFPLEETPRILLEWRRVLKIGGIIEFRIPNLRAICTKYVEGEYNAKLTSWLIFGGQDYSGNFHYVGFDRYFFGSVIVPLGFKEIEYKNADNNFETKYQRV